MAEGRKDKFVEAILERIKLVRHFEFREYKRATLKRRIERRMVDRKIAAPADYLKLLSVDPTELDA
ncbi:MAG: hypothetical protein LC659_14075, partial [Myxococcales bacterium]|nr:hypothetical protein [Myxococcales bacterium]